MLQCIAVVNLFLICMVAAVVDDAIKLARMLF